jgi:hypothetical protein
MPTFATLSRKHHQYYVQKVIIASFVQAEELQELEVELFGNAS